MLYNLYVITTIALVLLKTNYTRPALIDTV